MPYMSFDERVQYIRAAIENDEEMYNTVQINAELIKRHGRRFFGELCVEIAMLDKAKIFRMFPWLEFDYSHVCVALDEIVSELE